MSSRNIHVSESWLLTPVDNDQQYIHDKAFSKPGNFCIINMYI